MGQELVEIREYDQAKLVVDAVQELLDEPYPDTTEKMLEVANWFVNEAIKLYDEGGRDDVVIEVLNIAGVDYDDTGEEKVERSSPKWEEDPPNLTMPPDPRGAPGVPGPVGKGKARDAKAEILNETYLNEFPVPKEFNDDPTEMPRDISNLTDQQVRRLSGEFNAYMNRAKWLHALAVSDLANANHLRDHAYRLALKTIERKDADGKSKLKEIVESEACETEEYSKFNTLVLQHQREVTMFKALVDIYGGNVDRLSREWTMRTDEYNRSHGG